jgi:hypothetical protein
MLRDKVEVAAKARKVVTEQRKVTPLMVKVRAEAAGTVATE